MDITITTWADGPDQQNIEQETRLTADARAHVAIHLGHGVYIHLDTDSHGNYTLTRGDYRPENAWLKEETTGNAHQELSDLIGAHLEARQMYERLWERIVQKNELDLALGDDVFHMLHEWATQNHVTGPEWEGGMRMSVDQKRAKEWREEHQS